MNRPLKITHSYEFTFDNNQVKLSLAKKSILIPVFDQKKNQQIGFILDGPLGITADLVVHSEEGAVGEIVEETYSKVLFLPADLPFLSLDHVKEMSSLEEFQSRPYDVSSFQWFSFLRIRPPNGKAEPQCRVGGTASLNKSTNKAKEPRSPYAKRRPAQSAGKRTKALSAPAGVSRHWETSRPIP